MGIREIVINKAKNLYGEDIPENINHRIERELEFIHKNHYENRFILTAKAVNSFKARGEKVTPKGRIGGSLIAYLLGISDVNPIEPHYICNNCKCVKFPDNKKYFTAYDLEDMLCPECGNIMEKHGYGIPFETVFGLNGTKSIDFLVNVSFDVIEFNTAELIQHITGATAVFNADLRPDKNGIYVVSNNTAVNKICDDNDSCFKFHVTSHDILDIFIRCVSKTKIKIEDISFYDDKIYSIFQCGDTAGLSFFNSEKVKEILLCVKPKCFSDLVRIMNVAFSVDLWDNNGKELVENGILAFEDLPLSKESIMLYLIEKGLSKEDAYHITNRIRYERSITESHEETMRNHKISEEYIQCLKKVSYLMPKPHTVTTCKVIYYLAYFKVYYNDVFNNAVLSSKLVRDEIKNNIIDDKTLPY